MQTIHRYENGFARTLGNDGDQAMSLNETMKLRKFIVVLVPDTQLDPSPDKCCKLFSDQELEESVGHVHP